MLRRFLLTAAVAVALSACSGPVQHERAAQVAAPAGPKVVAISVDGLNVAAIDRLGRAGTPTLHRLIRQGAGTLNARTEHEQTVTLPNHTSMVTGRPIDAAEGGHGVTWNDDRPETSVEEAAGQPVDSVFSQVHADGGTTALYSTKEKFGLFDRSWPDAVDTFRWMENQRRLVRIARADLADGPATFTFLHVSLPDRFGHEFGGMSDQYLDAVRRTDTQLGTVLRTIAGNDDVVVILTSDHGFATGKRDHALRTDAENYRIAFLVWGAGVSVGDLYTMNPAFRNPRDRRTTYAGKQPVRNGNVANLALDLLRVAAVPDSLFDPDQTLQVSG